MHIYHHQPNIARRGPSRGGYGRINFKLYVEDIVFDINKGYSTFIQEQKELIKSLRSGKRGWIEAMVKRSLIKGLDIPNIILNHAEDRFFSQYAFAHEPKLVYHISCLRKSMAGYLSCSRQITNNSQGCHSSVIIQCLQYALDVYFHTKMTCKYLRSIC